MLREEGEAGATGRNHVELLGEHLDLEAGARVAGSRFAYLKGPLVRLELALVQWVLTLLEEKGFVAVIPPVLVRESRARSAPASCLTPSSRSTACPRTTSIWWAPREVPLASLHAGEILGPATLPLRYAGFSTCFRREAGAAGKDTQGIFRVHQFDKVEMFTFVEPDESQAEHERLLAIEEEILQALGIPYRVVNIAVDDLGCLGRQEVRPRGLAAGAGPLPRAHLVLEHDRLPGAPPRRALAPARGRRRRATCTR